MSSGLKTILLQRERFVNLFRRVMDAKTGIIRTVRTEHTTADTTAARLQPTNNLATIATGHAIGKLSQSLIWQEGYHFNCLAFGLILDQKAITYTIF